MNSSKRGERTLAVLTRDENVFQKLRLELLGVCDSIMCEGAPIPQADVYFTDVDTYSEGRRGFIMSRRGEGCDLAIPFPVGAARALLLCESKLSLDSSSRSATLGGRYIRLTDIEFALLSALMERSGSYASREELLEEIWGKECDTGVVNVYIHYLREKLECDGAKVILSSRREGYKIDERYLEVRV